MLYCTNYISDGSDGCYFDGGPSNYATVVGQGDNLKFDICQCWLQFLWWGGPSNYAQSDSSILDAWVNKEDRLLMQIQRTDRDLREARRFRNL